MLTDFKNINTMGVINITPNSFSDPKKFFNTDELIQILNQIKDRKDLVFDFGFESTAPMNEAVSVMVELDRFNLFFNQIKSIDLDDLWISFDTYKVESYRTFESHFKGHFKGQGFIFNDVSGVIDEDLLRLLIERKNDPHFKYIYSFSHIPSRDQTLKHMSYIHNGDILNQAFEHFKKAEKIFSVHGVLLSVVFDPGFGFSKSYEQNWTLLNQFSDLQKLFSKDQSWLFGLSKKSFLRKSLPADCPDPFLEAEKLHENLIKNILQKSDRAHRVFRVHDFDIVKRARGELNA